MEFGEEFSEEFSEEEYIRCFYLFIGSEQIKAFKKKRNPPLDLKVISNL